MLDETSGSHCLVLELRLALTVLGVSAARLGETMEVDAIDGGTVQVNSANPLLAPNPDFLLSHSGGR